MDFTNTAFSGTSFWIIVPWVTAHNNQFPSYNHLQPLKHFSGQSCLAKRPTFAEAREVPYPHALIACYWRGSQSLSAQVCKNARLPDGMPPWTWTCGNGWPPEKLNTGSSSNFKSGPLGGWRPRGDLGARQKLSKSSAKARQKLKKTQTPSRGKAQNLLRGKAQHKLNNLSLAFSGSRADA